MGRRYYCEYCDKSFPDNKTNRKNHLNGVHHRNLRSLHYAKAQEQNYRRQVAASADASLNKGQLESDVGVKNLLDKWLDSFQQKDGAVVDAKKPPRVVTGPNVPECLVGRHYSCSLHPPVVMLPVDSDCSPSEPSLSWG